MGKVSVIKPGLYSSIQDLGRFGHERYGIPRSGAMDQKSATLANLLVGNTIQSPVIEITQIGPYLSFSEDTIISLTGADISPTIDGRPIKLYKKHLIQANQTLAFGKLKSGYRCYLGIKGLQSESVLGSYSQYPGITTKQKLSKGDSMFYLVSSATSSENFVTAKPVQKISDHLTVYPGPEMDSIAQNSLDLLLNQPLSIKENDRMGYQVVPAQVATNDMEIITAPVIPGTVQLTPSGRLLILMRDAQVTGGYPRVFQLSESSIDILAQKRTNEMIKLQLQS